MSTERYSYDHRPQTAQYSYDRRLQAAHDPHEAKAALQKLLHLLNEVWSGNYEVHEAIDRAINYGNLAPQTKKAYEEALKHIYAAGSMSSAFYKYMEAVAKASKL
jgi:hypothetical protein